MRWLTLIAIVFVIHVALIFIFGAKKPTPPLQVKNAPTLALLTSESGGDWMALNNATLFGLPNQDGFAGLMWVALPPLPFRQQDWTEKPRWLTETDSLSVAELVTPFNRFVQTNRFAEVHFEFNSAPQVMVPALPSETLFATGSTLEVEGDLAKRGLLNPITPPTLPSADVIAPSKVQVLVDGAGHVVSAVLLPLDSFLEASATVDSEAEQRARTLALQLARTARFAPLTPDAGSIKSNPAAARLSIGLLIFNWQTMPESAANGAANQGKL
jgi:hypothetical protein